ncbi:MAG: ABC transporter substrate-binding protein [Patescibacteria group bacterium]
MLRYFLLVVLLAAVGGWLVLRWDPAPIFTEGMVGQPVDLIPGQGPANLIDEVLEKLLFRSLLRYNEAGEIEADLADSYRLSADGLTYAVVLKESAWRDGRPVTAADVAFTFARDIAFSDITIEQVGEREVNFVLKTPLSSFPDVLTRLIAPAHFREIGLEQLGNRESFIAGIKQEGETIKEIKLKVSDYQRIETLRFKFFTTEEDLRKAAQSGAVDGLALDGFSDPSFALYQTPLYSRYFALFFNLNSANPLVKNRKFRQAAAIKTPLIAGGFPVPGPLSGTWAQGNLSFPRYQEKSAGKFNGSLVITAAKTDPLPQVAEEIAQAWSKNLGIRTSVRVVSPDSIGEILENRSFEAVVLGQEVERDPDRYNLWHSSAEIFPGQNISAYADPRSDRALEEARRVSGRSVRRKHYLNFQRLFIENNPAVLLYHPPLSYWVNRKFTGPDLTPVFLPEERFWNFSSWSLDFVRD